MSRPSAWRAHCEQRVPDRHAPRDPQRSRCCTVLGAEGSVTPGPDRPHTVRPISRCVIEVALVDRVADYREAIGRRLALDERVDVEDRPAHLVGERDSVVETAEPTTVGNCASTLARLVSSRSVPVSGTTQSIISSVLVRSVGRTRPPSSVALTTSVQTMVICSSDRATSGSSRNMAAIVAPPGATPPPAIASSSGCLRTPRSR